MAEDDILGPGPGHNSKSGDERLLSIVERFERLEEDKKAVADDQKELLAEAKAEGWDVKTIRKVVAIRKRNKDELDEENALLELYMSSLGMI